ncbi:LacI family DNA-binding transcriptional regulator [Curtobacterium sp. Csp1]|uniref:LacI family DNA-binding transcriptional regulator n=1 Tax=unclassified Curtobacterium TaxID=257496 RepID=UPI00159A77B8|nr:MULTISPECIES: LacI family DNA-binding transcriptional regulator [unclassified Curtobacterium]QKS12805.1 LacI family DNA-binding transcriptional regulator [Curtobacterium sp. csp3]QKS20336.1 LacI family DNA-binding transcriptional regulator [Curtobacterium sp. Csp1]
MTDVRAARTRATIQDVADEAGLSRGTVSRVLNDEPYVSAEAREAVQAAVRRVGYVRSAAARSLVTRRSGAVALIVHEPSVQVLDDPNIGNILIGTNTVLSEADQQLVTIMVDSGRDNERVVEYLRGGFVDGAIVLSARDGDPVTRAIEEIGLPACFVGHPSDAPNTSYIAIDNRAAAEQITRRLVETGRQRIGMLASGLDRDSGQDRLEGFTAALGDRFDPSLVARNPLFSYTAGVEGMRELLDRAPDLDGVFAASDAVAAGAMDVLQRAGRSVPGDVGVVGFDDSAWALRCDPPLSTVRQPARTLGEHAAQQVLAQIAGTDAGPHGLILPTEVVWRGSA